MSTIEILNIPSEIVPNQEIVGFAQTSSFTYHQLKERVMKLASVLRLFGLASGDRIAVIQTNSNHHLEIYFAAAQLGAVYVPLNYRAKEKEVTYMVDTVNPKVIFAGKRYIEMIEKILPGLPCQHYVSLEYGQSQPLNWHDYETLLSKQKLSDYEETVNPKNTSVIMFTSGTTSLPKGVNITFGDLSTYVYDSTELADGTPRGSMLLSVPLYHIAGFTTMLKSLFCGRKIELIDQFDSQVWLETVQSKKVTHAFLVPTMLKRILSHQQFHTYNLSSLKMVSYGAAPMPLPVIKDAIDRFPKTVSFTNAYGQTETTSTVTILGPEDHDLSGPPDLYEKKLKRLGSVGKAVPGVEIQIIDKDGEIVSQGSIGEIIIGSSRNASGYWNDDLASKQTMRDKWIYTGDLGRLDEEGYLFIEGRSKELIIRGGENIAPQEVENILYYHSEIKEVAVFGLPDEEWGEQVVAAVVLEKGSELTEEEIINYCRNLLASFKKPEKVLFLDELPRNSMGKILKNDLREMFSR